MLMYSASSSLFFKILVFLPDDLLLEVCYNKAFGGQFPVSTFAFLPSTLFVYGMAQEAMGCSAICRMQHGGASRRAAHWEKRVTNKRR